MVRDHDLPQARWRGKPQRPHSGMISDQSRVQLLCQLASEGFGVGDPLGLGAGAWAEDKPVLPGQEVQLAPKGPDIKTAGEASDDSLGDEHGGDGGILDSTSASVAAVARAPAATDWACVGPISLPSRSLARRSPPSAPGRCGGADASASRGLRRSRRATARIPAWSGMRLGEHPAAEQVIGDDDDRDQRQQWNNRPARPARTARGWPRCPAASTTACPAPPGDGKPSL